MDDNRAFPMDKTDTVILSAALVERIQSFAVETAPLMVDETGWAIVHDLNVPPSEQIRIALERMFRLLISGEDADSIRWLTRSPWGVNE